MCEYIAGVMITSLSGDVVIGPLKLTAYPADQGGAPCPNKRTPV